MNGVEGFHLFHHPLVRSVYTSSQGEVKLGCWAVLTWTDSFCFSGTNLTGSNGSFGRPLGASSTTYVWQRHYLCFDVTFLLASGSPNNPFHTLLLSSRKISLAELKMTLDWSFCLHISKSTFCCHITTFPNKSFFLCLCSFWGHFHFLKHRASLRWWISPIFQKNTAAYTGFYLWSLVKKASFT